MIDGQKLANFWKEDMPMVQLKMVWKLWLLAAMFQEDRKFSWFWYDPRNEFNIWSAETEIWRMNLSLSQITEPMLPDAQYKYGISLFLVDSDFCLA